MKKTSSQIITSMILAILAALLLLAGCSHVVPASETDDPAQEEVTYGGIPHDVLFDGLQSTLSEVYPFLTLTDFSVDQSQTEEKSFTASITATAEGVYAEDTLSGFCSFTKYDQGWSIDSCDWEITDSRITNWPDLESDDADLIPSLLESRENYYFHSSLNPFSGPEYTVWENDGDCSLIGKGIDTMYGYGYQITMNTVSFWSYDAETDAFVFSGDRVEGGNTTLTADFTGKYYDRNTTYKEFTITEQTDNSLTVTNYESRVDVVYIVEPEYSYHYIDSIKLVSADGEVEVHINNAKRDVHPSVCYYGFYNNSSITISSFQG